MTDKNFKLICDVESKLIQVQSMAKIALNNTNHKYAGYDEPFIEQDDMSNLLWAIVDLVEQAFDELQEYGLTEGKNNG
ncbi:hypothetical protein J3U66_00625 [Gilliamella sp. B2969]|uniref:hypothetical protein n=1 Tax=unclassified Gilliamella TaxID=2685620 RepID=UPI00226981D2|nr:MULTISPECIES: hypothetical protein [unclassified Gilliamella]MCX8655546.1 hypothetical protein [Gilliamella sp. B2894]MCX8694868.1 hypothetical protein [Gilliamella sp. B2881]MCX8695546.1 hypothetical protein [Gilliamella sp. B2828]MCX8728882.1 hypothetical protein [Gilliamella sp. B2969]